MNGPEAGAPETKWPKQDDDATEISGPVEIESVTQPVQPTDAVSRRARGPHGARGAVRESILAEARLRFVQDEYDAVTLRSIARAVGCDAALVSYYFGSKQELFREAMRLPADPAATVLALLAVGTRGAGERIVRFALRTFEETQTAGTMAALLKSLTTDAMTARRLSGYLRDAVLGKVGRVMGAPDFAAQVELSISLMAGVALMRYIVRLEPLASMSTDELVAQLAPFVQLRLDLAGRSSHW